MNQRLPGAESAMADQFDPIALQVLRTNLEAIAEEGFRAIIRTAISPVVTESLDAGCTLLDADGNLLMGGGALFFHFGAASQAVRSITEVHGDTIAEGDIFVGNDPHSGIAVHPNDVMVLQPVFCEGRIAAWIGNSAHLIDVGGARFGSYDPAATECYQEALRLPPVRLYAAGVEQRDVWAIMRNNVRMPVMNEMDLRGLIAGCNVANEKLIALVASRGGLEAFTSGVRHLRAMTAREMRRRIGTLPAGDYRMTSWAEWETEATERAPAIYELYRIPCHLTVEPERLVFDYAGAAPQCLRYYNSKPWIIRSIIASEIWNFLGQDLPYNQGVFDVMEVVCPEKSILNSRSPAPIAAAHSEPATLAAVLGVGCLNLALAATEDAPQRRYMTAQSARSATANQAWRIQYPDGSVDGFLMQDAIATGSAAAMERDGNDLSPYIVARRGWLELNEVEVLESWYPILIREKRPRAGAGGAGMHRAGAGMQMSFRPHGIDKLTGVMNARRPYIPSIGMAGGYPGSATALRIHRADGKVDKLATKATGVVIRPQEWFEFQCSNGGGWGDPLDRDPAEVAEDVRLARLEVDEATVVYGVVMDVNGRIDAAATSISRDALRRERLARAAPARKPVASGHLQAQWERARGQAAMPLYPGIEQRGRFAMATASGAVLAVAPDAWVDGCPVLSQTWPAAGDIDFLLDAYLDPVSGRTLFFDLHPRNESGVFESTPDRWLDASREMGA